MSPKIAIRTTALFDEDYIRSFVAKAIELGHIPTVNEFSYCEPDNSPAASIENTTLTALSFTAAINTEQHNALIAMVSPQIRDIFKLFTQHGVVLSIYEHISHPTDEE